MQKTNKETGTALVGIELLAKEDYSFLVSRMKEYGIDYSEIIKDDKLFGYLV
jgi:threonine dehydratase